MGKGDEEAFLTLYRRCQAGVYRFALRMSGCTATAEEVTQEVFLSLIQETHHYDPAKGALSSYLFGIARHIVLRRIEKDRRYVPLAGDFEHTAAHDALGEMTRDESIESLRRAVLTLPPRYREAVVLCDLEEMPYADAAKVMGCRVGSIRSRLHRARALLLAKLGASKKKIEPEGERGAYALG